MAEVSSSLKVQEAPCPLPLVPTQSDAILFTGFLPSLSRKGAWMTGICKADPYPVLRHQKIAVNKTSTAKNTIN